MRQKIEAFKPQLVKQDICIPYLSINLCSVSFKVACSLSKQKLPNS